MRLCVWICVCVWIFVCTQNDSFVFLSAPCREMSSVRFYCRLHLSFLHNRIWTPINIYMIMTDIPLMPRSVRYNVVTLLKYTFNNVHALWKCVLSKEERSIIISFIKTRTEDHPWSVSCLPTSPGIRSGKLLIKCYFHLLTHFGPSIQKRN